MLETVQTKIGLCFSVMYVISTFYQRIQLMTMDMGKYFFTVVVISQMNFTNIRVVAIMNMVFFVLDFLIKFNPDQQKMEVSGISTFTDFYSRLFLLSIWIYFTKQRGLLRFT